MKISPLTKMVAVLAVASVAGRPVALSAQDAGATNAPVSTAILTPTPPLSPPALQVLQLAQAKVSDGTILAFVKGSQDTYNLNAPAIIFLRQQGVSDAVLTAMLTPATPATPTTPVTPDVATNLASAATAPVPQPTPAPIPVSDTADAGAVPPPDVTVVDNSSTTYIDTSPADSQVVYPSVYPSYYYPPVIYSFGVYGGYHGGGYGGYHGGGNGGYHGGGNGGYHGGNNGGNNGGHGNYGGGYGGNGGGFGAPHH